MHTSHACVLIGRLISPSIDLPLHVFSIIISRDKLRQAYEFTLNHIGIDYHSSSLWTDYIAFLQQEYVEQGKPVQALVHSETPQCVDTSDIDNASFNMVVFFGSYIPLKVSLEIGTCRQIWVVSTINGVPYPIVQEYVCLENYV